MITQPENSAPVVFVFSFGQIAGADIPSSIGAFGDLWSNKAGDFKSLARPFCWIASAAFYAYDILVGGNIDKFKLGLSTEEEFRGWMRSHYNNSDAEIDAAWNALCAVSDQNKENAKSLCEALARQPNAYALVIGMTNSINIDYIKKEVFKDCNDDGYAKIKYATSYEYQKGSLVELASTGLSTDYEGHAVVSLHRDITDANAINIKPELFSYMPYNPSTGVKLGDVIDGYFSGM